MVQVEGSLQGRGQVRIVGQVDETELRVCGLFPQGGPEAPPPDTWPALALPQGGEGTTTHQDSGWSSP